MNKTSVLIVAVFVFAVSSGLNLNGADPIPDRPEPLNGGAVDPFLAPPTVAERLRWKERLSIQGTLVSGRDVVLTVSSNEITLANDNRFLIDENTAFVSKTRTGETFPASIEEIVTGTPISFEVDITQGGPARRVVIWRGFGPRYHKIYGDRLQALVRPLWKDGDEVKPFLLQQPEESMTVVSGGIRKKVTPGEPLLLQLKEPQKSVEILCGKTFSVEREFSAIVAFRSHADSGYLTLLR